MSACLIAKAVLGAALGLLFRADPLLAPLGLGFDRLAPPLAAAWPINGGTGFFIAADGTFIAPHHVLGDCRRPALQTPAGLAVGRVIAASAAHDIVVARAAVRPRAFAAFAAAPALSLSPQRPLAVVGFAGCGGPASRTVNDARPLPLRGGGLFALAAEAPFVGGNSGSPVIDGAGAVVGMLIARATAAGRTGFAVDGTTLAGFLLGAGVAVERVPERLPLAEGLAAALAGRFTFPALCLY
jgi:S1-C subfamily serine protease